MTQYSNMVQDFPKRVARLLTAGPTDHLDVTRLLTLATAAINIPYERLKEAQHPSHDTLRHGELKVAFDLLLTTPFLGSTLFPEAAGHSWFYGKLATVEGDPDAWQELSAPAPLGPRVLSGTLLIHVRNALAHGNIFTMGRPTIERLVLLKQVHPEVYKFNYLICPPSHLRQLVTNWLAFLGEGGLPTHVVPESGIAAAWTLAV